MKIYKRAFSLLCALLLMLNLGLPVYAAGAVSFTVATDKQTYYPGDTIYVTFTQNENLSAVSGYELLVYYDPDVLEWDSEKTVNHTGLTNATYSKETPTTGTRIKLAEVDMNGALSISAGTVSTVAFTAKTVVENGTTLSFSADIYDNNFDAFTVSCTQSATVSIQEIPAPEGYSVYASADSDTTSGGNASVSIYADNTGVDKYNAYDLTLTYDTSKLTLTVDDETGKPVLGGAAATDDADATVSGNQIHIAGVGEDKTNDSDPIVTLSFTMNGTGTAEVVIRSAKVDNKGQAIEADAPEAAAYGGGDNTPGSALIKVPYNVEKPDYVDGLDSVLPGEDYTFFFTDTDNYTYKDLTVTMGGQTLTLIPNDDGSYTVEDVNGDIKITVTQTPNTYNVTVDSSSTATVTAPATATYGVDYKFTVSPTDAEVTVKDADGKNISYSIVSGEYVILGKDISGDFTIKAMRTEQPDNTTKITFEDIAADEIVGGLIQYAPNNTDFDFTLIIQENTDYKAMIGEYVIPLKVAEEEGMEENEESETSEEATLTFTIPAEKLTGTPITVTIRKTSTVLDGLTVEVSPYIQLDETTMFLVTAKAGESALAYGDAPMYRSEKYDAYSWLVISADTVTDVKAAAEGSISVYTGNEEKTIAYDFDVNQTNGTVDINDAQLTYDMYTAEYSSFEPVTMDKFLEADLNGDKKVSTEDAAAIINEILNPTMQESQE